MRQVSARPAVAAVLGLAVWLSGLLPASAASAPPPVALPAGVVRGTLPTHGFISYAFSFPGNQAALSITLDIPAATTAFDQAVGFNVYLADGTRLIPLVPSPQQRSLQFSRPQGGTAVVQLYNYATTDFAYALTQTGILPPPAPLPPIPSGQVPLRLDALNPYTALPLPPAAACSLLPGQTLYYLLRTSAAGGYLFRLTTQPANRGAAPSFGVRVLDGSGKELARSAVSGVNYGEQQVSVGLAAGQWYVELYNVSQRETLNGSLTVSSPGAGSAEEG